MLKVWHWTLWAREVARETTMRRGVSYGDDDAEDECRHQEADPEAREDSEGPLPQISPRSIAQGAPSDEVAADSKEAVNSEWPDARLRDVPDPLSPTAWSYSTIDASTIRRKFKLL